MCVKSFWTSIPNLCVQNVCFASGFNFECFENLCTSAQIQIVSPSELMTADQLTNCLVNFSDLLRFVNDDPVAFCAKFKWLKNEYTCPYCQQACSLVNRSDVIDGKQWHCKLCKRRKSIRMNSFFERSHLSIHQILTIVYGFSRNWEQKDIAFEAKVI